MLPKFYEKKQRNKKVLRFIKRQVNVLFAIVRWISRQMALAVYTRGSRSVTCEDTPPTGIGGKTRGGSARHCLFIFTLMTVGGVSSVCTHF